MRVGNAYAATLQPDCALFVGVQPFELLPTETWHTDCIVGSACGIHEDSGRAQASSSPRVGAVGSNSNEADASQVASSVLSKQAIFTERKGCPPLALELSLSSPWQIVKSPQHDTYAGMSC